MDIVLGLNADQQSTTDFPVNHPRAKDVWHVLRDQGEAAAWDFIVAEGLEGVTIVRPLP